MKDRVVLVTGANGGLGRYVTQAFLDADATVFGTSRKIQQSEFASPRFSAISGDIASHEGARAIVEQVVARAGRLDVLVHTVGGFAGGASVADTDDAMLQTMMDLNFNSLFYVLRAGIPVLRKSGRGRIIAVGSRAAIEPGPGLGAYSASKAAMVSLVQTVALENKDAGLSVNAILPGTIDTPANRRVMPDVDFSKWVQPANIASLILWLASDAAREITGAAIPIYGTG